MPPTLLFFLEIALAILGLLLFHINFRIVCSSSMKKCHGKFDRVFIKSVDDFGWYGYFIYVCILIDSFRPFILSILFE